MILLSHGLGGSREVGTYLGEHWAARGFVVVAMQHALRQAGVESSWAERSGDEQSSSTSLPSVERVGAIAGTAFGSVEDAVTAIDRVFAGEVTRLVHEYGAKNGFVKYEDKFGNLQQVEVDWEMP